VLATIIPLCAMLALAQPVPQQTSARPPRPNIIIIQADALGYGDVSA
jgi:hypothetical protein